jgi:hypothetical protein
LVRANSLAKLAAQVRGQLAGDMLHDDFGGLAVFFLGR